MDIWGRLPTKCVGELLITNYSIPRYFIIQSTKVLAGLLMKMRIVKPKLQQKGYNFTENCNEIATHSINLSICAVFAPVSSWSWIKSRSCWVRPWGSEVFPFLYKRGTLAALNSGSLPAAAKMQQYSCKFQANCRQIAGKLWQSSTFVPLRSVISLLFVPHLDVQPALQLVCFQPL